MKTHRYRVYLAGPISGCNERQKHGWRQEIIERWGEDFDFIDPTAKAEVADPHLAYSIVEKDQKALEASDGVLANMWRESIGTAIGIAHANAKGRPVVVVDSNWIDSRILAFYADAVERTPNEGMKALRDILRTEHAFQVLKRGGAEEPFSRKKLVASLRSACRAAGANDVVVPAVVLPRVLKTITEEGRRIRGTITTTEIRGFVVDVLEALENEPGHESVAGVRDRFAEEQRNLAARQVPAPASHPLKVPVQSGKSHSTIWGKTVKRLEDIPAPARDLFRKMTCVEGIAEIRITAMSKGPKGARVGVSLAASMVEGTIEGKLNDSGPKGQVQCFQVVCHDARRRDDILAALKKVLGLGG